VVSQSPDWLQAGMQLAALTRSGLECGKQGWVLWGAEGMMSVVVSQVLTKSDARLSEFFQRMHASEAYR